MWLPCALSVQGTGFDPIHLASLSFSIMLQIKFSVSSFRLRALQYFTNWHKSQWRETLDFKAAGKNVGRLASLLFAVRCAPASVSSDPNGQCNFASLCLEELPRLGSGHSYDIHVTTLYRKPMSWWPLRSSKTAKVSKGGTEGGKEEEELDEGRGTWHNICLFHRKWGGQGDDSPGAEDASHPEAGQHRRAEGGVPQEGEALPCLWICWEGQINDNVIIISTLRVCVPAYLYYTSQFCSIWTQIVSILRLLSSA